CKPLADTDAVMARRTHVSPRGGSYLLQRPNVLQEITCEISFDADPSSSERDLFQIQPRLFATQLSCLTRDEDNVDQRAGVGMLHSEKSVSEIEGSLASSDLSDQIRAGLAYAVELDEASLAEVREDFRSAGPIGCVFHHFLPDRIVYSIDTIEEDAS